MVSTTKHFGLLSLRATSSTSVADPVASPSRGPLPVAERRGANQVAAEHGGSSPSAALAQIRRGQAKLCFWTTAVDEQPPTTTGRRWRVAGLPPQACAGQGKREREKVGGGGAGGGMGIEVVGGEAPRRGRRGRRPRDATESGRGGAALIRFRCAAPRGRRWGRWQSRQTVGEDGGRRRIVGS